MKFIAAIVVATLISPTFTPAQSVNDKINWPAYQDLAVDLMRQYLRVNTSNPPGNEIEAAKFFKAIFDKEGIPSEIFEYKPGRANIIARYKGSGAKRPLFANWERTSSELRPPSASRTHLAESDSALSFVS